MVPCPGHSLCQLVGKQTRSATNGMDEHSEGLADQLRSKMDSCRVRARLPWRLRSEGGIGRIRRRNEKTRGRVDDRAGILGVC